MSLVDFLRSLGLKFYLILVHFPRRLALVNCADLYPMFYKFQENVNGIGNRKNSNTQIH